MQDDQILNVWCLMLPMNGNLIGRQQVTPAQIREAEKSLKIMEVMIEAMTPGLIKSCVESLHSCKAFVYLLL